MTGRTRTMTRMLVISPSAELAHTLSRELPAARFVVTGVRPGAGVLGVVRQQRPGIAVVDRIDERPEAAQLEIALVKELCPQARIIVLSGNSSEADAPVVAQGTFYYMAAPSRGELLRVIQAAERSATGPERTH